MLEEAVEFGGHILLLLLLTFSKRLLFRTFCSLEQHKVWDPESRKDSPITPFLPKITSQWRPNAWIYCRAEDMPTTRGQQSLVTYVEFSAVPLYQLYFCRVYNRTWCLCAAPILMLSAWCCYAHARGKQRKIVSTLLITIDSDEVSRTIKELIISAIIYVKILSSQSARPQRYQSQNFFIYNIRIRSRILSPKNIKIKMTVTTILK